jgi:hypothetical protein
MVEAIPITTGLPEHSAHPLLHRAMPLTPIHLQAEAVVVSKAQEPVPQPAEADAAINSQRTYFIHDVNTSSVRLYL